MAVADLDLWSKARITHSLVMPLIQPYEVAFVVDGYPAIQSQMLSRRQACQWKPACSTVFPRIQRDTG